MIQDDETDSFQILSIADAIISAATLDKKTALDYVDKLHHNIETLSIGDKECVSSACRKVIEWLSGLDTSELEKEEWFSLVRKLCTTRKGGDHIADVFSHADISKELHRDNVKLLVSSNVLLRLIEMCFTEREPCHKDATNKAEIDFKDSISRFSLLSSILDCGWEKLSVDQVKALRHSSSTILNMIPDISASPNEKIFIRPILRAVNKIVEISADYEGHEEFSKSMLDFYRQVIDCLKIVDAQEHVVTSLITNLKRLNDSLNSEKTMLLLWEMLMKMCERLRNDEGDRILEISPIDDFPKSLDTWSSNLVEGTIQETLEDTFKEKVYPREEVINGIISKLDSSTYKIHPTLAEFESVVRTCLQTSSDHAPSLCSSLSRFYTKLMKDDVYTLKEQNQLVDVVFELWNASNEKSAIIMLKKIFEGDTSRSLFLSSATRIVDQDESSEKKFHIVLEDYVRYTNSGVTKELATRIVTKINEMDMKSAKSEDRLMERLHYLNIILGRNMVDDGLTKRSGDTTMDLSVFNELLNSKEYTRMLGVSMKIFFGIDKTIKVEDDTFLPPVNEEYVRRLVNGEKLLSYHHVHYFLIHSSVSKSKSYLDYLIAMNGGPNIEPLLTELSSTTVMDRMIQSMLGIMHSSKEMFPSQLSSRFNSALQYIVENVKDGTLPSLSLPTLKLLTKAITNMELRYVLSEFSTSSSDRETARPRMEKLIQIAKCSLLTQDERGRLLDGVKLDVQKAISSILNGYAESPTLTLTNSLLIQQKLISILRCHSDKKDLDSSTIKYMDLYLRLSNPTHSFECLLDLLMGALCESPMLRVSMESGPSHMGKAPLSPYITSPLVDRFTRLLLSLFSLTDSKFLPTTIQWSGVGKKVIEKWLNAVGEVGDVATLPTSLPLIVFLSKIIQGENMREETRSMVMAYIKKKGPSFVIRALRASPCKPVFFHALTPIILHLRSRTALSSEVDAMLIECVPLLFAHPVEEMIQFFPVLMQATDRYAQTQLNWKSLAFPVMDEEGSEEMVDPIQASFKLLAQLSTFKGLIFAMMESLGVGMQTWLMNIDHDIMVLRGVTVTPNTEVIWKVQLISQALGYISCVAEEVRKREEKGEKREEWSDEEEQEEKLLLVDRREDEEEVTRCTFVNTSKEFTKQHWYNCYTCGMIDSEGVCTLCALNCHRGHDISYSKLGSFFCDCGAKKCGALKGAKNKPPVKRMKKMKKAKRAEKWTPHVTVPADVTKEEVKTYLHVTQEVLTMYCKSLNDLILGIEVANEGKFNIESRREGAMKSMENPSFKYDECIMVGKIVENEGLEQLDRRSESIERNVTKECSEIVRLRDGSTLFLHVNEHSNWLSLVYMGVSSGADELGETRVERESLPFAPKRITVRNDHIAITGVDEMAFLRVSLDSGDIIQKDVIRMKEASASNPILKAEWYMEGEEKESVVLAVATLQFVRIYSVFKDLENYELELVLPMGNVVDLTFIKKKDEDYIWIAVLSSPSHLYYHQLGGPGPSILDDTRSIYLTNTLALPVQTLVVSLHFSQVTRMLYISFEKELFCAHIKEGDVMELAEDSFHKLEVGGVGVESFVGWAESDGMVAAISHPAPSNKVIFIYPTLNEMLIQVAHLPQSAHSISLAPSSSFESLMGLVILSGYRRPAMLFTSNWANQPDLWMEHRPMKMDKIAMVEEEEGEECSHDQLVTLFETCSEVREVEYSCKELDEFYSSDKLTERLKTPEKKAVVSANKDEVHITIRVSKRHYEVKGLRLEVEGSNGPRSLSYNGKEIELNRRMRSIYDIALSPNETIKSERPLSIRLGCKETGTTTIVSLRAYGDSREDSYARCLVFPPLSLPYQCVLHSLSLLNELWEYELHVPTHVASEKGEMREWIAESCLLVIPPRACRPAVTAAGKKLLRRYWRGEKEKYHDASDKVIVASFAQFGRLSQHLPLPVLRSYLSAMRQMMMKRYDNIIKYAQQFFGDVLTMGSLMHREMECVEGDETTLNLLISVYLQFTCSLLANDHPLSEQVMAQLIGVVTNHKKLRVWRLREELRKIVRDSLDGVGLKNGAWIEKLIGVITERIVNEIRMPIPVWWKGVKMDEEKIDLTFQRAISGMSALVEVGASVMRELEGEKVAKILTEMVDRIDTHSVMREEDDVRVKNVRIAGVIAFIGEVCRKRGMKKERSESSEASDRSQEEEDEEDEELGSLRRLKDVKSGGKSKKKEEADEGMHDMFTEIVQPLLHDETRRDKLMSLNFRLLEETLKFVSSLKEGQRMDSGWTAQGDISGLSTSDCLLEYYLRVGKWTLELPALFLHPMSPIKGLSEDRKRIICELMMVDEKISLRAKADILLLMACKHDKKKYTETLSEYAIVRNLEVLRFEYLPKFAYTHEDSTAMIEIIGRVRETATDKNDCWRRICEKNIRWILVLTSKVSEPVGVAMLELIQAALRISKEEDMRENRSSQPPPSPADFSIADTLFECAQSTNVLKVLIMKYLLGKEESRRWLMHSVCRSLMQLARRRNQIELASLLFYQVVPMGRRLGERGAQLADLCSAYLPTLLPASTLHAMALEELTNLEAMIAKLESSEQKGSADWMVEEGLGWREALYLSPDPCIQCLRPNDVMETMKLSAIKGEARYTTNALMFKLNGHYEINKVVIKLADIKKTRMFGRVSVYYTWKAIDSAVDLKSNRDMWKLMATTQVSTWDNEIALAVSIPIVTNGLVIELSEVNEMRGSSQVHCPRCSSLVRPNPGVCDNCGENVYQCVKCRAINYDEKEPFLCQACGYCKYARMEMSVVGRLQPTMVISADNDKPMASRASKSMNKLQWEMDVNRAQLRINTVLAQSLTIRHPSIPTVSYPVDGRVTMDPTYPQLALIGPNDSRSMALTECMRKIRASSDALVSQSLQLVSIREAMRKMEQVYSPALHSTTHAGFYNASDDGCIGCLTSSIIHSISLLRSLSVHSTIASTILSHSELIYKRMVTVSSSIDILRDECESLMICLCHRDEGVERLCGVVMEGRISPSALARSLVTMKSVGWSERMDTLIQCAMNREDDDEAQIGVIQVLLDSMKEAKSVLKMMEERKKMKTFMEERGPSGSEERTEEKEDGAWTIVDAIINSQKDVGVDDIEKERRKGKEMEKFLWRLIFSRSIFVRSLVCRMIRSMMSVPGQAGAVVSICLQGLSHARLNEDSSRCDQFFLSFDRLIERGQIKLRLFQSNFHLHLMGVILSESTRLTQWERGEHSVCHSSGGFIYHCTNLLTNLLSGSWLESLFLSSSRLSLLVPLLHSCILLRRVTIKKNRPIARALHQLESLLRRCTAEEGLNLLTAAVACLSQVKDEKSRADIVGVILETLDPRENESDEFLIQVEKDAAQEDFLQGRMQHNPYKSGDVSMGPLMRDIKNKICRESELIAFLDDDTGMELLVNGKIISLSLAVSAVYDKEWRPFHPGEPMVIVYRMRGLMGDAVEPFVETIDEKSEGECLGEEEARLLMAFLSCGGVSTTLRLLSDCSLSPNGCLLLVQLRRLLLHLLRVEKMKKEVITSGGVSILLGVVKRVRALGATDDQSMTAAQTDLLKMVTTLVTDPVHHPILGGVSGAECEWLLSLLDEEGGPDKRDRPHSQLVLQVTKILGNAVLGSDESEEILVKRLREGLNWEDLLNEKIDSTEYPSRLGRKRRLNWMDDVERRADSFTLIVDAILPTVKGTALKHKLIQAGVIEHAVKALVYMHPPLYGTVESPEWKTYLARPALKLILGLLKGMAKGDEKSQVEIAKKALPMLHRLEQVSSAEHLGTLAENVMEALSQNKEVAAQIDKVRDETKQKKRQMAMAMREKQLSKLGMQMGRKGEVKVSSRAIVNEPDLGEASDPLTSCCICRESILTGTRVPATYAYAIPFRGGDSPTHCSLSLSVMVHVDCHFNAIRRSNGGRNADEWTKAALHNSGARCNMIVPIRVSDPSASDWNSAISRMESDLESVVPGGGPITRYRVFLDMCNLIRKFILNRSFSESAGGGGRESNMQYLGILHLLALNLPEGELACTMASERLNSFLLTELTVTHWNEERLDVLRAFLRDIKIGEVHGVARDSLLRESLLQWTFIDLYFNRVIPMEGEDRVGWLRSHFGETLKKTGELVKYFDTTLLPVKKNEELAVIIGVDMNDALSLSTVTTPT